MPRSQTLPKENYIDNQYHRDDNEKKCIDKYCTLLCKNERQTLVFVLFIQNIQFLVICLCQTTATITAIL